MGQKVHPVGFRLGYTKTWESKWYSKKEYRKNLLEDLRIRAFVKQKLKNAGVSRVEIERASDRVKVNIHTARPGIIIGKKGTEVDKLKDEIQALTQKQVYINIHEIRKAEIDAQLIAENVAMQLGAKSCFSKSHEKKGYSRFTVWC